MFIEILQGKIHRATVTDANLNYVGSITIDMDLVEAAGMVAGQKVQVVNNNNGERLETYILAGERGTGTICLNGAAARKVQPGDIVIIVSYLYATVGEMSQHSPKIVFVDEKNQITSLGTTEK